VDVVQDWSEICIDSGITTAMTISRIRFPLLKMRDRQQSSGFSPFFHFSRGTTVTAGF
jgi:hypothetical protein